MAAIIPMMETQVNNKSSENQENSRRRPTCRGNPLWLPAKSAAGSPESVSSILPVPALLRSSITAATTFKGNPAVSRLHEVATDDRMNDIVVKLAMTRGYEPRSLHPRCAPPPGQHGMRI